MKKITAIIMSALIVAVSPCILLSAASGSANVGYNSVDICEMARNEAMFDASNNGCLWGSAGLFLGPIGILLGFFIAPPVPPGRLIGKTPAYIESYSNCFKDEAKGKQALYAVKGCLYSLLLYGAFVAYFWFAGKK